MKIIENNKDLKLTNEGKLEVFFLGTGTPFSKNLFNNNFIIVKGDQHILVDFGINAPVSLDKFTNIKPTDLTCLLPTHSHSDHIGGLEYLLLSKRYMSKNFGERFDIIITDEYKNVLWDRSLKGGLEWNEINSDKKVLSFEDYFIQHQPEMISENPRRTFKLKYGEIDLEIFPTNHIPPSAQTTKDSFISYGLFIDNRILITCDTKFDPDLIDIYGDRAEVIFHDCSLEKNPVHASLPELKTLTENIKSKTILMHYDDNFADYNVNDFLGFAKQGASYIF